MMIDKDFNEKYPSLKGKVTGYAYPDGMTHEEELEELEWESRTTGKSMIDVAERRKKKQRCLGEFE